MESRQAQIDIMTRALIRLYATLFYLYPRQFRAEFGEEMQAVFEEVIHSESGHRSMLQFLRELRDLPGSLVKVYSTDWLLGGHISMNEKVISPSTRWQAFLGVLPFLAFGAANMLGKVDHFGSLQGLDAEMGVYFLALAGLLVGYAAFRCGAIATWVGRW